MFPPAIQELVEIQPIRELIANGAMTFDKHCNLTVEDIDML